MALTSEALEIVIDWGLFVLRTDNGNVKGRRVVTSTVGSFKDRCLASHRVSAGRYRDNCFISVVERGLPDAVQVPHVVSQAGRVVVRALERNRRRLVDDNLAVGGTDQPV